MGRDVAAIRFSYSISDFWRLKNFIIYILWCYIVGLYVAASYCTVWFAIAHSSYYLINISFKIGWPFMSVLSESKFPCYWLWCTLLRTLRLYRCSVFWNNNLLMVTTKFEEWLICSPLSLTIFTLLPIPNPPMPPILFDYSACLLQCLYQWVFQPLISSELPL